VDDSKPAEVNDINSITDDDEWFKARKKERERRLKKG
jgi:hypothetical protein